MPPRLISQLPPVPSSKSYSTIKLALSGNVKIQCSFNSTPKSSIEWYLDDKLIPIDDITNPALSHIGKFTVVATLTIRIEKLPSIVGAWQYGGMYVAKATNIFGTAECATLALVEGVFQIRDQEITLQDGQEGSLKCYVISSDVPEINWFKTKDGNTTKFPDTTGYLERYDWREIVIESVKKEIHEALYECNAMLQGKKVSKTLKVTVARPPIEIWHLPDNIILIKDNNFAFQCNPKATLDTSWYSWWEFLPFHSIDNKRSIISPSTIVKESIVGLFVTWSTNVNVKVENTQLPDGVPSFLKHMSNTSARINIKFVKTLHMGIVTCVVQNSVEMIRKSIRIMVPVIEYKDLPPSSVNFILGDTLTINCSSISNELPTSIIWFHKTRPFPLYRPGILESIYQFSNGTLVARNITDSDPLEFMCSILLNSTLIVRSKLVKIIVQVPARIMPMSYSIDVVMSSSYNLTCDIYGDSNKLEIEWLREDNGDWLPRMNSLRAHGPGKKIERLYLQFFYVSIEDGGNYKCRAKNAYNNDYVEMIVRVYVVFVPGSVYVPYDLITVESRTMSFEWQEPSNNGIKSIIDYVVTWRSGDEVFERNVTKTKVYIEGLRPNHVYNVTVRARNEVGLGDEYRFSVMTKEALPDGPVMDLLAVANSSTSLVLTWRPTDFLHQNGRIINYEVCYRRLTRKEFSSVSLNDSKWYIKRNNLISTEQASERKEYMNVVCNVTTDTKVVLTGLLKFTGYAFRVGSINANGIGPFAFVKGSTLEDFPEMAPIAVTCTSTSTSVSLQWNPPPQHSINGILQKYTVKYFRADYYGFEKDVLIDNVGTTRLTLDSLVPYSNYSIQVAVSNSKGPGPLSAPLSCVTKQGAPSPPDKVKAMWFNTTCMLVVWTPSLRPNGILSRYNININKLEITLKAETNRNYFKHVVCGLNIEEKYTVTMTAYTNLRSKPTLSDTLDAIVDENRIVSIPHNIIVTDSATVTLDCETIHGTVSPKWFFYGNPHSTTEEIPSQNRNGSLIITNVTSSMVGTYECRLSSQSIKYNVSVRLVANDIPDRPDIYYHIVSTNSIYIAWRCAVSPRQDDPIKLFLIKVNKSMSKELISEINVSSLERTFNISNIICGSEYKLQLYAVNRAGHSVPETLSFRTLGTKPQWANDSNLLAGVYPRALCFRFGAFHPGQGCPPDKYIVKLSSAAAGYFADIDNVPDPLLLYHKDLRRPCYNVSKLHPNTEYHYKIEAINNAGSTSNIGYAKTSSITFINPFINRDHTKVYIFIVIAIVIIVVAVVVLLFRLRRIQKKRLQVPATVNNDLRQTEQSDIITPISFNCRDRRLPDPPSNNYDSGIASVPIIDEVDEELIPYSTYIRGQIIESHPVNPTTDQDNILHSYPYPDMSSSSLHQIITTADVHSNINECNDNSVQQPLLPGKSLLLNNEGYSIGNAPGSSLIRERPRESIGPEQYLGGGSLWSNTTSSSTKELDQVFHADRPSRAREPDESHSSILRPLGQNTLSSKTLQRRPTKDVNCYGSYFESGSSDDDPGIRRFTQELCPGQQVVTSRFTQPALSLTHQSSIGSSHVPVHSNQRTAPLHDPSRFPRPATLPEEDESDNYQNHFVIV